MGSNEGANNFGDVWNKQNNQSTRERMVAWLKLMRLTLAFCDSKHICKVHDCIWSNIVFVLFLLFF